LGHCATMAERGEALGPILNPTVLITRPRHDSERFADALRMASGLFEPILAPAFEIETTGAAVPAFDGAIFTSRAGVEAAPQGGGQVAFCVGDATALQARGKGYAAISADGDVEDLLRLILAQGAVGSLVHLRGEKSRGNVSARLRAAGLLCEDVIVYRKAMRSVDDRLAGKLQAASRLIIPAFSAETVSIIARWGVVPEGAVVIAISDAVAQAAVPLRPSEIVVSEHPELASMTQAVAALIA